MVSWWGFCDACREAATRHLVVLESIVERDNSGFVLEHRGHDCHCDCCYQRIRVVFCTASTGFRLHRVKETRSSSLFPFFLSMVVSCVYFVIIIARMSFEDQCQGGVLMKNEHISHKAVPTVHDPASLDALFLITHSPQ